MAKVYEKDEKAVPDLELVEEKGLAHVEDFTPCNAYLNRYRTNAQERRERGSKVLEHDDYCNLLLRRHSDYFTILVPEH